MTSSITSGNNLKLTFGQRIVVGNISGKSPLARYADYAAGVNLENPSFDRANAVNYYLQTLGFVKKTLAKIAPTGPTSAMDKAVPGFRTSRVPLQISKQAQNIDSDQQRVFAIAGKKIGEDNEQAIDELHSKVMATDTNSPDFTKRIIETNEFLSDGLKVEINTESKRLDEIVNSNEAVIFIANHGHPYDGCIGAAFLAELYKTYEKAGKTTDIPRPKLVAVKSYIDGLPPKLLETFNKVEGVGINIQPYLTTADAKTRKKILTPLAQGIASGQNHILIFPEGRRGFYRKDLPMTDRLQDTLTPIVQQVLQQRGKVKVVPLGFSFIDGVAGIHIGNPVHLSQEGEIVKVSRGEIATDSDAAKNNSFYKNLSGLVENEMIEITHNGTPAGLNKALLPTLITKILGTNLDIAAKTSVNSLQESLVKTEVKK